MGIKKILAYPSSIIFYLCFGILLVVFHPLQWITFNTIGYKAHKFSVELLNFFIVRSLNILGTNIEKPFKAKLINKFIKNKYITRFAKSKLSSTSDGNLIIEVLSGQESYKIKSFVQSNIWGLFDYGKSNYKKGDLINCYFSIGPNMIS